jgi:hypothetical protein
MCTLISLSHYGRKTFSRVRDANVRDLFINLYNIVTSFRQTHQIVLLCNAPIWIIDITVPVLVRQSCNDVRNNIANCGK